MIARSLLEGGRLQFLRVAVRYKAKSLMIVGDFVFDEVDGGVKLERE